MDENYQDKTGSKTIVTEDTTWIFNKNKIWTPKYEKRTGFEDKTRWDWLQLAVQIVGAIAIPLSLLVGILQFNAQQNADNLRTADEQRTQLSVLEEQQEQTTLATYLDQTSQLLLTTNLRAVTPAGDAIKSLVRARTLEALLTLNPMRKSIVLKFLYDAGLINRDPFPAVNLFQADLRGVDVTGFQLSGVDLAGADLSGAIMSGADLSGADLRQAKLNGANLTGAMLDYTPLIGADLSYAKLTSADLSGTDFTGANLTGAIFQQTDISGTNPQNMFTQILKDGRAFTLQWKVILEKNTLLIAYNEGTSLPVYGRLDLTTSKLQLLYGPRGNWGTSVVLLPALWSNTGCPGDYCQTSSVTGGTYSSLLRFDLSQNKPLSFTVYGTIAGLSVVDRLTFSLPTNNSISVTIYATSEGTITLDQYVPGTQMKLYGEAFKPIILTAMYDSSSTWTTQGAAFGNQRPLLFSDNYTRITRNKPSTFELVGGTSSSVRNAPTIMVTLNSLTKTGNDLTTSASVTLQVLQSRSDQSDNVSMWAGIDNLPDAWSYTVTASMP